MNDVYSIDSMNHKYEKDKDIYSSTKFVKFFSGIFEAKTTFSQTTQTEGFLK